MILLNILCDNRAHRTRRPSRWPENDSMIRTPSSTRWHGRIRMGGIRTVKQLTISHTHIRREEILTGPVLPSSSRLLHACFPWQKLQHYPRENSWLSSSVFEGSFPTLMLHDC